MVRERACYSYLSSDPKDYMNQKNERLRIPQFTSLLEQMKAIHIKKNQDYAQDSNPYSNFEIAGDLAKPFTNPVDIAFATLIGVKIARLQVLLTSDRPPNNESIDDTFLDLATYTALWASYRPYLESPRKDCRKDFT